MKKNNKKAALRYTESEYKENKKLYQRMEDSKVLRVRMNLEQRCLLESMMEEKGYVAVSPFIKDTLFGFNPKRKVVKKISNQDQDMSVRILREAMLELAEKYTYVLTRYNKDMAILHHIEGSGINKWINATERWHRYLIHATDSMFWYVNLIIDEFGLREMWEDRNTKTESDGEPSPEEMMEESKRQYIERIANGRGTRD